MVAVGRLAPPSQPLAGIAKRINTIPNTNDHITFDTTLDPDDSYEIEFSLTKPVLSPRGAEHAEATAYLVGKQTGSRLLTRERIDILSGSDKDAFVHRACKHVDAYLTPVINPRSAEAKQYAHDLLAKAHGEALVKFENICIRTMDRENESVDLVAYRDIDDVPDDAPTFDLFRFNLPLDAPIIFYGASESLKSTAAAYVAVSLARQGVNVLYIDMEATRADSKRRMDKIAAGSGPCARANKPHAHTGPRAEFESPPAASDTAG